MFVSTRRHALLFLLVTLASGLPLSAQPLQKSAVQVDAGDTKQTGETFGYRLTYSCNNTSTNCTNSEVIDLLPAEVEFLSTVPASPGGDVAAVEVTPNFGGTGRTRVRFDMIDPLTAGNSGDLIINVRFPRGSTPDGTVATNTADGINLETTPGTVTTPPVDVTAVASTQVNLTKTVQGQALLDLPTTYRLRINVPNDPGALDIAGISVSDTLPAGVVFNSASPAADCEPGCQNAVAPALAWSGPFSVSAGSNLDFFVTVTFPSATFTDGQMVTNTFTAGGTPLGQPPGSLGVGDATHPVNVFTPNPDNDLAKRLSGPNPPTYNQEFSYTLDVRNNGNVDLENFVLIDNIPPQFLVDRVGSGRFNNPSTSIVVEYETNLSAGFVALGTNNTPGSTFDTYNMPPLPAGEYVTRIRWTFGTAPVGMVSTNANNRPRIWGSIIDPDNQGNPVNIGDTISNCGDLTSVYDPGGANTPVNDLNQCRDFDLSGPFVQFNPDKQRLTGGGPFNPGQTVSWRLRIRSSANSSDPVPLEQVVVADLLPVDLIYTPASWTFNDLGNGLPAPQTFEEIPNFAGTGRTLLRWTWNAASGDLGVGQGIRIVYDTTIRNGAPAGDIDNTMLLTHNDPSLGQRCGTPQSTDILDLDNDSDTTDRHCAETASAEVVGIAQLVSSKQIQGNCDGGFGVSSAGTLIGGSIEYLLTVQNVGTVAMENFVLIDILPFLGDTGVLDTNPRLSDWTPLLTAPITPPPGTAIFYSTSGNPCRPEVGGINVGCDPPNWTTVAPDPISSVRSFKIEFGDQVVGPGDSLQFEFQLTTPAEASLGGMAFNSFAYLGERSDGLGSLSAEPNKVGVEIGPCPAAEIGDFVWVDTDGDGTQNDGDTGLNDVFVELFTPGADNVPRTFDDVRIATALTSNDVMGHPGWYLFPGLAPGDYYVQFNPPPTYAVTVNDAGGDDALDSDADPSSACTPVVNLVTDESDLTIDIGLLPPQPAAIGNYVWFDRDSNGSQDESPFLGVNGVAVRLYIDDGDGVPEPGGDDGAPVAVTATDDDIYDRPGYYLFDLLTPGIGYFVEFVLPASATGFTGQDVGDDTLDSDADTVTGVTSVVTPASGERILTLDAGLIAPVGDLVLGDQVWCDDDNDGIFEPENGELGVDGVTLRLYLDVNGDGEPTLDEYLVTTETFTSGGFAGRYRFDTLDPGDYIVVVDLDNFGGGGELSGKVTSTGNDPAPDPDDDANGDDNGTDVGAVLASRAVTLADNNEPTTDDGDDNTNLTVDFGFTDAAVMVPEYDYGDAPDVISGPAASDYQTTALDSGAFHLQGQPNSPYLGNCVDADDGLTQDVGALGDDSSSFGLLTGTCAVPGDDEDGVVFNGDLMAGAPASIDVTAAAGVNDCVLNAWIDWDRDGVFGNVGDEILAADVTITAGNTINLTPTVPAGTTPGTVYGRFRCDSSGGLTPTGAAADGEVEDHRVAVIGTDLGDAPDTYGTLLPTGAVHQVSAVTPLFLGACVDTEPDGQPNVGADGDDVNGGTSTVGLCAGDDEDGVVFPSPLVACGMAPVTVSLNAPGIVDAWIDFDNSGVFDAGEKVFNGTSLGAGSHNLMVAVPCSVGNGTTYTRFRLSSAGIADPVGSAADGEVEDHVVDLRSLDLGDAPNTYQTTLPTGPSHTIDSGAILFLGTCVDTEVDGQPIVGATGDDTGAGIVTVGTCTGNDDEDGVAFSGTLLACSSDTVAVTSTAAGLLDAWIDFNGNGTFEPTEQIANGLAVAAGANVVPFTVPCAATLGTSYSRFRLSSAGVASPTGPAPDGEIEDHVVTLAALDLSDAPNTYDTQLPTGAQHVVSAGTSLYLGACVDTEADGQPNAGADGDDLNAGLATVGTCVGNDDEDGVALPAVLMACDTQNATVTAASAGVLDAWIDFDGSGTFEPAEKIADGLGLGAGASNLPINVPCDTVPGTSYSRFRFSSTGSSLPAGQAADGEVEDYVVELAGADLGDAPDTYGTLLTTGPRHAVRVGTSLFLGACVDTEADGQPAVDADGDDLGVGISTAGACATANDDEDGVVFDTPLIACEGADLTITAASAGVIDGWIDFGGDGTFDAEDQVFDDQALTAGANTLTLTVPCTAVAGDTYSRFRLSSAGVVDPTGPAMDGEVEDYVVELRATDFGDAPDSYFTVFAADGARHGIVDGFHLGATVDSEPDGQPSTDALGDGADEDGITFPGGSGVGIACTTETLTVTVSADGVLDAWIDFDGDLTFDEPRDRIADNVAVNTGSQPLTYSVPCDVTSATTYARFRFSSAGVAGSSGPSEDGEVEDYVFEVRGLDYGDAPDPTYPTLLASDGARHVVLPVDNPTLGTETDTEPDGQPSAKHNGDDTDNVDDEDGVSFPEVLIPGTDGTVELEIGSTGGSVNAWIDFNGDGDWDDAGEQIAIDEPAAADTTVTVSFPVPVGSPEGTACVRVRISSQTGLSVTGQAPDGEVEDHLAPVGAEDPQIGVNKMLLDLATTADTTVFDATFEIGLTNLGNVPLSDVNVLADMSIAFADAAGFEILSVTSADFTPNPIYDGVNDIQMLDAGQTLAVGENGTLEVVVRIDSGGNPGPYFCSATGTGTSPEGEPVDDESEDGDDPDPDDNGDPEDNDTPTPVDLPVLVLDIPTLDTLGLMLMVLLLTAAAFRRLRPRGSEPG